MKPICYLLLILMAGSTVISVHAQSPTDTSPPAAPTETTGRSANDVVDMLAKRLSLSDDQKSKILPIVAERRQKIQEVRTESLRPRQKRQQVEGILEDSDNRINALLTAEQQKTYAEVEQEMRARAKAPPGRSGATIASP